VSAGDQADGDVGRRLKETQRQRAGELTRDQRGGMDGRQLQPVEEPVPVVLGEVLAGSDDSEDAGLDEGEGEREGQVGGGREAGQRGRRLASRMSGKTVAGMIDAGWRTVRMIERRASSGA
jgi:hypothetical protein